MSRKRGFNLANPFFGSEAPTSQVHFSEARFQPRKPMSRKQGSNLASPFQGSEVSTS
ncbi:MAG: hypothetical protein RBR40_13885 [Tenuifilaceae bacterium]|nr:hypothetical protein [Tenuifilaceae bacterium]